MSQLWRMLGALGLLVACQVAGAQRIEVVNASLFSVKAGADARLLIAGGSDGVILRSTDGGASWQYAASPMRGVINQIVLGSGQAKTILALASGALLKSVDAGESWQEVALPGGDVGLFAAATSELGGWLVTCASGAILRSEDDGASWRQVVAPGKGKHAARAYLALQPATRGVWFAVGNDGSMLRGSQDGSVWRAVNTEVTEPWARTLAVGGGRRVFAFGTQGAVLQLDSQGKIVSRARLDHTFASAVAADTRGQRIYVAGADGHLYWGDGRGQRWHRTLVKDRVYLGALGVLPDGSVVVGGSAGYLARSTDGGQHWVAVDSTAQDVGISSLAVLGGSARMVAVGEGGLVIRSEDGGQRWLQVRGGVNQYVNDLIRTPANGVLLGVGNQGLIVRSEDSGRTWQRINAGLEVNEYLYTLASDRAGSIFAAGAPGSILRSDDEGKQWHKLLDLQDMPNATFSKLVPIQDDDAWLVFSSPGATLRSSDHGASWADVGMARDRQLFAYAQLRSGILLASGEKGMLARSTDGGKHWDAVASDWAVNFEGLYQEQSRARVWALGAGVLMYSDDDGAHWRSVSLANTTQMRHMLELPGGVLLATGGRGSIFRSADGGQSWQAIAAATDANLRQPFVDARLGTVYVPGRFGTLLRSKDWGLSWQALDSHTEEHLKSLMLAPDESAILAIGERLLRIERQ